MEDPTKNPAWVAKHMEEAQAFPYQYVHGPLPYKETYGLSHLLYIATHLDGGDIWRVVENMSPKAREALMGSQRPRAALGAAHLMTPKQVEEAEFSAQIERSKWDAALYAKVRIMMARAIILESVPT